MQADFIGSNNVASLTNKYGGIKCNARSVYNNSQELEFIPIFHCHKECTDMQPYKCTNGRCYSSPDECEDQFVDTQQIAKYEPWQHLTYPDKVWNQGIQSNLPRLSSISLQQRQDGPWLKFLQTHTSSEDWMLYPTRASINETKFVKARCASAGRVECITSSSSSLSPGCTLFVNTGQHHWSFTQSEYSHRIHLSSDFYTLYHPR